MAALDAPGPGTLASAPESGNTERVVRGSAPGVGVGPERPRFVAVPAR